MIATLERLDPCAYGYPAIFFSILFQFVLDWIRVPAISPRNYFSNVLYIVAVYRKYTRKLTFQNFCAYGYPATIAQKYMMAVYRKYDRALTFQNFR